MYVATEVIGMFAFKVIMILLSGGIAVFGLLDANFADHLIPKSSLLDLMNGV